MANEMKHSGVVWIGDIPKDWDMSKFKAVGKVLSGYPFDSERFSSDSGFPLIRIRDITSGVAGTYYDGKYPKQYIMHDGDFLLGMDGDFNVRWWQGGDALLNQRCCRLTLNDSFNSKYVYYLIPFGLKLVNDLAYSTTVKHLSVPDILNLSLLVPPLDEQTAIADFLDTKCAEIDGLLGDLDAEVKTLAEYKKSIIAETVTKGLNPNVELVSADLGWIKEIPKQWRLIRWRFVLSLNTLQNIDCRNTNQLQFKYGEIIRKKEQQLDNDVLRIISNYTVVEKDDIMINGLNLNYDFNSFRVGQVREKGIITSAYICLRTTDKGLSRFYMYYLKAMDNCKVFHGMGKGIRLTLSYDELKNLLIPVPPMDEQIAIANYLDEKCKLIEESITDKLQQIEKLKEYKASLIYEYVTGKKQVI